MALKNGENSIVVQIDFKCHINVKLALDDGDSSLHVSQCSYSSSSSCCCLHTLLIIMATMRLHTHTHTRARRHRISIGNTQTQSESESEGQSLDFWPWLDRWFVSVQASHEFRWTPINNHIRPMLLLYTPPAPACPCYQHEKWPMATRVLRLLSLSLQVVAGRAPQASAVGVYL